MQTGRGVPVTVPSACANCHEFTSGTRFRPIGDTDSETAFCALLARIAPLWDASMPSVEDRVRMVATSGAQRRALGPANFLYTDGDLLSAHADRRTRPDGRIAPPGLTMLHRGCAVDRDALPDAGIGIAPGPQNLVLFASVPLTGENWQSLPAGALAVARNGQVLSIL